ncbi:MAG: hypothetical protein AVDCRST_MAG70-377 [uncultured Thermomicrobiales bacterium]|uniref:Cupin 2 conserved barrel domain-containing protein n=1 Tax=uncultured Thermomicrobiales bacterium TaxID=1645740 RepID=A0A6J4UD55_9BACT|nr:MAG: hypothetical protein AVDCRST_MAG70-377 [uncultured Thermomicrobiales bacterium]
MILNRAKLLVPTIVVAGMALGASVSGLPQARAAAPTAQESVPTVVLIAPGVITQTLSAGMPGAAPGQRLALSRLTLMPGGIGPAHVHPGMTVVHVESGAFGWTLLRGAGTVTRASGEIEEVTEPGTEVLLVPGDALVYEAFTAHTARGVAEYPTVVVNARLLEADQPAIIPTNDQGTPTP